LFDSGNDVVLSGIDGTDVMDVAAQRANQGAVVWAAPFNDGGACGIAPDLCLGVPYFNWGPAYLDTATKVGNGSWTQSWDWNPPYWTDLTDNTRTAVGWVNGSGMSGENQTLLDEFVADIAAGDVNVWTGPVFLQDGSEYVAEGSVASDVQIWYLPQLLLGMTGPSE
jgi:simple sugar transport system substrate-binding protein